MADVLECKFPVGSLVPKCETGVLSFLQKYPEFDGRDVTIAIFDSGVDPKAAGLEVTKDGSVKVIERFDCSGCGDTNTSTKVTANADGYITGLSGRQLKITQLMKDTNKDGHEYRVGLKSLHDLYPSKIREKVTLDVKTKKWDGLHRRAVADVAREWHALDQKNSGPSKSSCLSFKDKIKKENLDSSIEFLNNCDKKFLDIKTTYDVIVYNTEEGWQAVLDTSEKGELEKAVCLGEYSKTHELKHVDDFLSISINVHDNGDVLEFVGMCSSHGTHVAAIASGNQSDKELDGVAPNAKIVSLTIGDGRLGSMETGAALVRAIIKVMELCNAGTKIDVINMSYGEHAHWSNSGRVGELMNEVVNKYGVVWVASAGNHGPALCTVGTPPDISQPSCIGVGAYVSPQMMEAEYALREKLPANVYTWTSRDPCIDGGQGVTICAPGAAITSVPEFTMSKAQLMNGTSMAAPHVAGSVALLISGLKKKGIQYSPYSIKRALWNTATKLSYVDPFAQGNGLLNVEKAFEHLVQYGQEPENMMRFSIKVGNLNTKGIHMRKGILKKPVEHSVAVEPIMFDDKNAALKDKINFNVRLTMVPTESWVQCGGFLDLCYGSRTISVRTDPTGLPAGVHTAKIKAYDSACVEKGTLFEIPITLIQPHVLDVEKSRTINSDGVIEFKPNTIQRLFVLVPNNATWAVLKMISLDDKENHVAKFFVHTMQILPMKNCKALETMKILPVGNEVDTVHAFKCEQNNILELCIAKYWSNFGDIRIKYSLEFHGINSNASNAMHAANGVYRIDLTTLGPEEISPGAQLKAATMVLKPTETKISPLSASRDVLPPGRQIYQNLLTYSLHISKSQEVSIYAPIFYSVLYESEYESQFWMLFDSNKMMIACGDAYSNSSYTKLEKGDYTIRLQVRHEKKDVLEKISEATMLAVFKLQNPISLDIYDHYNQSVVTGKKVNSFTLNNNSTKSLYIAPLSNEKLSKASIPMFCSWLTGSIAYVKDDVGRKCDNNSFQYILAEGPPSSKSNNSPQKNKNKQTKDEYKEALRDYQCSMISKLETETAEEVYKEVLPSHPNYLPLHLALIQNIDNAENKGQLPYAFISLLTNDNGQKSDTVKLTATLNRVVELSSTIINETDKNALLAFYGMKSDNRPDASKIKTNMDKQKATLLEAFVKKGIAASKLMIIEALKNRSDGSNSVVTDEIDEIYCEISTFIDPTDMKVINFSVWHAYVHRHFGRMAKYLQKMYDEKCTRDILEEIEKLSLANKWLHVSEMIKKFIVAANPGDYRPF